MEVFKNSYLAPVPPQINTIDTGSNRNFWIWENEVTFFNGFSRKIRLNSKNTFSEQFAFNNEFFIFPFTFLPFVWGWKNFHISVCCFFYIFIKPCFRWWLPWGYLSIKYKWKKTFFLLFCVDFNSNFNAKWNPICVSF